MKRHLQKFREIKFVLAALFLMIAPTQADVLDDASMELVFIEAGDVTLGATLFRPAGAIGDLPGIVVGHGSAPSDRDDVGFYIYHALSMGFAVLSYDKRGVGESTGSYVRFSVETSEEVFQDLAMDMVYATQWLANHPNIDETRIGIFGGSQAGWIMPLAASMEPMVSFIIIGEGSPVTAGEESIHGDVGGDGEGWSRDRILAADAALREFDGAHGFDPGPILQELDVPTLWIFGLRDDVIPVAPSLERLAELIEGGKTNNHLHIFAYGDHNFRNSTTGERYNVGDVANDWLIDIGVMN